MIEQYSNNSFFQDNTVLDVVNDMSKDFGNFKNQLSTNQFNNVSQLETKLENVQQYIHYVDNRISTETNSLFNSCKNQFDCVNSQFSHVMTVGNNVDSKVQNLERRVDSIYDDLRKFENNINSRLSSLEEIRAMYARNDEMLLHINKQLEQLFYMVGKNETKIDQAILNKEAALSARNPVEYNEQFYKDRNRKLDEIYQNLNKNVSSELPAYNVTKNNFDIKLDNLEVKKRQFDFNTASEGFNFNGNTMFNTDTSQTANNQSSTPTVIPETTIYNDQNDISSAKARLQKSASTSKQPSMTKAKSVSFTKASKS